MKKTAFFLLLISMALVFTSCKNEYKKGTTTSTTYESEFLNMKFTAPTGYTFITEEAKGVSEIIDCFDLQETKGRLKSSDVYEMEAATSNTYPNVAVTLEKLPDSGMTIKTYVEKVENASVAEEKYTIAGEEYIKMIITSKLIDPNSTLEVYCRIQDGYLVSIMINYTSDTASQKDTLLNAFTALK